MDIHISVRNLVGFVMRSGDIDNRMNAKFSEDAMQEGSRVHRMLQKREGEGYQAEVTLKFHFPFDEYEMVIEGRADGIISRDKRVVIDEIKGTYRDLDRMKEPELIHLAQAKCYAYFLSCEESLSEIGVRMTYCNLDTEEVRYFFFDYTNAELKVWFEEMMQYYKKWADFEIQWKTIRKESILELEFPFPYREGQKELATAVYRTLYHKKKLFIEAPTGVGKTITTVFPTVKAMGVDRIDKIFYLTAKTITRTVAEDTFRILQQNGTRLKTVVLTAKEKICPMDEMDCNPEMCPYAKGHYNRINDAIYDILTNEDSFSRSAIEEYSKRHQVCPFEFSLDMSLFSDAIVCDYNYLFDPHVYLKRFFSDSNSEKYAFLIDEAHNLVERGREMYSAILSKEMFMALKIALRKKHSDTVAHNRQTEIVNLLIKQLEKCNQEFLVLKRECIDEYYVYEQEELLQPLVTKLTRLFARMEEYLDEDEERGELHKQVLDDYFELSHFLLIWESVNDDYRVYTRYTDNGNFEVKLFCVNPSQQLKSCMDRGVSSILFSATFLPIQYYKRLLGGEATDYEVYAKSVFNPDQKGLFIAQDVTTKYTRRTQDQYRRIAKYIYEITDLKKGNYFVFFPSHSFAQKVYQIYQEEYCMETEKDCLLQKEYMSEEDREHFLGQFQGNAELNFESILSMKVEIEQPKSLIAFCIMGGIFGEGIDLKGDRLIGAIIVGNGLPQVCSEREILRKYFDDNQENGFDFAYRYPGMNKVLQSAGRVIRTAEDVGIVVLLEERFLDPNYSKMFPREWNKYCRISSDSVQKPIESFWKEWT